MDIFEELKNKKIKLYQLDDMLGHKEATKIRREFLEKELNIKFNHINKYSISEENVKKNIENMIGAIQIPLGIAGPIRVNGEHAKGLFYIPLATTEGALVASVNRGCSIITKCGGAIVRVIDDKMTRAPCFKTRSVVEAIKVRDWILKNFDKIKEVAESTTRHGKLIKIEPILIVGRNIYPRFCYKTGDAMGMNMVTIATEEACKFIVEELKKENIDVKLVSLSGNACVDKKPSGMNLIEGRGKSVVAEIYLDREEVEKYLKTTPEAIAEVNRLKNYIGSAISNSMGFNAHYANIVGAIFLATGQDEAHIVEGSLGITMAEVEDDKLYFSVTLPDLPLATVGGGTSVETQREALEIMGCYGSNKVLKFAEIVGAAVLAGELSLLGALASNHLAKAHKELGR
ncbi:3-hydroxy-3-methylglutaryl Coenzyme A reductase [Methanocaldococcus infernus ME]|uniref:3-hydroxy-3-methylglutaryl coenzyme A reductase n=1 Tax=Methanocaldococcus infernus (strain DSM 11812 / JCM 15783 / ME) TaxID=573063 RepID=D5VT87_METIM|nr:hydroxymethylglutaryl-CoA reductase (NADPH) [Methanocaldococcus infernus]ADG13790.1 3-hydroxy-3-methylglutaryl Coenzyme A reductase [Methanocaldococcus infernus ME]